LEEPVKSAVSRHAALVVASLALVLACTGWAEAGRKAVLAKLGPGDPVVADSRGKVPASVLPFKVSSKPRKGAVLRLGKNKRFPASALPRRVQDSVRLNGKRASSFVDNCPDDTVDLGTWCVMNGTWSLARDENGKNDLVFATQKCASRGGYVPDATQLLAAVDRVKLAGTIDDSPLTASIDEDKSDGLKDRREMTSTLVTTSSGSSAAGTNGVTQGSKGDPRQGEPDPVPLPADPYPSTLQYVTVYDNHDKGGFAGSKPVSQPELFRCAFNKAQGAAAAEIDNPEEGS
jgi:hypothetical protein